MPHRTLYSETYYHIYNRGNNKQRIFFSDKDLERFGNTITRYLKEFPNIQIHVWAFIPNHFHLLLSERREDYEPGLKQQTKDDQARALEKAEQISNFMNRIQQAYAMYFNKNYGELKKGIKAPVFEGRFKSKQITDHDYLLQVAYYIRYNALKHEIVTNIKDWPWAGVTESPGFPELDYGGLSTDFDAGFE